ncbi:MAG: choice-of-anchor D domain-containing protein, partial [Candidatus Krumholzibacteria bacterium]|nr:choice-of-anchor D domain-containing protein [Candidatus Krumholzibacteria bacterium]
SGTSMATPHVSGALALMVGRFPGISVDAGKNLLMTIGNDPLASLTGLCVSESRLNVLKLITDPDIIDPSAVIDLAAGTLGSNWAELVWSAPGDDGTVGTANSYDMRYSLSPITDELTWDAATEATGEPLPAIGGSPESMQVSGLDVQTTYYFNLRARDEYGNIGGLSNSPSVTTLGPPSIGLAPATLSATLTTGGTITEALTVTNTGLGVLDFSIPTAEYILPAKGTFGPVRTWKYDRAEKGAEVGLKPTVRIDGSGGPDAFGYNWIDSNEVGGPAFNWIEINTLGTAVSLGDDANSGPYAIGFPFSYYGVDYTDFQICSNGWLSFTDTGNDMSNGPLPAGTAPANMLAMFWDDLNPATGGSVYYYNDGTRLIVEFESINHYSNGSAYTMQAHLYPNGKIEYHYLTVTGTADSGTIGLQNADGTDGLTAAYNAAYVQDNLAVRFAAVTPWLSTAPNSGSLAAGASVDVDVVFSAAGLCGSHFDANLHVVSNDALNGDVVVPVGLDLTGAPDIMVDAATLDLGQVFLSAQGDLDLTVSNNGCADLTISAVAADHADFGWVATVPQVLAAGASLVIPVSFTPTLAGPISGILTLTSDDPNNPVLTVNLTGEGLEAGEVAVNPTAVYQVVNLEGTATQTVTVTNNGLGDLNFSIPSPDMYSKHLAEMEPVKPIVYQAGIKGAKDEDFGGAPLGSGGPDLYGYKWVDSDEPGGPMFGWVDISATGTAAMTTGDDSNLGPFPIGFPFEFYGNTFTDFRVSSNGFISFTSTATAFSNTALPNSGSPVNMIAPFWDDLILSAAGSGDIYYEMVHGDLIVMYDNIMPYSAANSGAGPFSFEVILSPTGRITMQYLTMGAVAASHTVGIQDGTGTIGLQVAYNAAYLHDNMVVEIRTPIDWLTVSPLVGTVPAGGSFDLAVDFNAAGLAVGMHDGQFLVLSDDPATPSVPVPATLEVSDLSAVGDDLLPRAVALDQNVPNPFNPMTDIKFSLPKATRVELRVYDVRGALVRNLISGEMAAGRHTQVWMGRDDQGQDVPSGVYFYRLQLDEEVLTRRMTLLK